MIWWLEVWLVFCVGILAGIQDEQVFLSAPQLNPSNSGKGKNGNYKRQYNKTSKSKGE